MWGKIALKLKKCKTYLRDGVLMVILGIIIIILIIIMMIMIIVLGMQCWLEAYTSVTLGTTSPPLTSRRICRARWPPRPALDRRRVHGRCVPPTASEST